LDWRTTIYFKAVSHGNETEDTDTSQMERSLTCRVFLEESDESEIEDAAQELLGTETRLEGQAYTIDDYEIEHSLVVRFRLTRPFIFTETRMIEC
jgi:hypothetical protein